MALAYSGEFKVGIAKTENGLSRCDGVKSNVMRPAILAGLAEIYLLVGRHSGAVCEMCQRAVRLVEVLVEAQARRRAREHARERGLANRERVPPQVVAVKLYGSKA
ncbi:MAG: hypothetical protein WAV78_23170 [Xanthobacteraceae bacterium]